MQPIDVDIRDAIIKSDGNVVISASAGERDIFMTSERNLEFMRVSVA